MSLQDAKVTAKSNTTLFEENHIIKIRPPTAEDIIKWTKDAFQILSSNNRKEMIIRAFKYCGITQNLNGDEDHLVHDYDWYEQKIKFGHANIEIVEKK